MARVALKGNTLPRVPDCHPDRKHCSHGLCLECYRKWYAENHREKIRDYERRHLAKNREKSNKYHREWKARNKEKVLAGHREYRAKNAEMLLQKHREYNAKNKGAILERYKKFVEGHPEKVSANHRNYYIRHKPKVSKSNRKRKLKYNYGLTLEEYNSMLESQGGACAICGGTNGKDSLCVDHDHKTGKVRGLLCHGCNKGIAGLKDNPEAAERAAAYLRKHNGAG